MKKSIFSLLMAGMILLGGCTPFSQTAMAQPAMPVGPVQNLATQVVVTLIPENMATQTPARTPLPTSTRQAYPAPATPASKQPLQTQTPAPTATEALQLNVASEPWADCKLAPGWAACDPALPAIDARVALASPDGSTVVVMDLSKKTGWQASIKPQFLDWSPKGDRLLAGLGDNLYGVLSSEGKPLQEIKGNEAPRWQPDNALAVNGRIHAADGSEAWLEATSDFRWILHVALAGSEKAYPIADQPTDQIYHLVSWVPGSDLILAQVYYGDNAAMIQGGSLFVIDATTGKQSEFGEGSKSKAPLGYRAVFRWNPKSALLAYIDTGADETTQQILGLKNFKTGQLQYPLPAGIVVTGLSWSPDGQELYFAAFPINAIQPNETAKIFTQPGIYSLDLSTDKIFLLTQPPKGAQDVAPYLTADGQTLLYARLREDGTAELHALQLADQKDWVIVSGWKESCGVRDFFCATQTWLAITNP